MPEKQTMVMPEAELEPRPGDLPIRLDRLDLCQQISLFKQLKSGPGVERLPGTLLIRHYDEGEVICRQGEAGWTAFYVLTSEDVAGLKQALLDASKDPVEKRSLAQEVETWRQRAAEVQRDEEALKAAEAGGNAADAIAQLPDAARCIQIHLAIPRKDSGHTGWLGRVSRRLWGSPGGPTARPRYIPIDAPTDIDYETRQAAIREGELFGEMSCLNRSPRSATAVAGRECYLLEMLRNVFEKVKEDPNYKKKAEEAYRRRVLDQQLRNLPLFADLSNDQLRLIRDRATLASYKNGQIICDENDRSEDAFIIRNGVVKVIKGDSALLGSSDVADWPALFAALRSASETSPGPGQELWKKLPDPAKAIVTNSTDPAALSTADRLELLLSINAAIKGPPLHIDKAFKPAADSPTVTKELADLPKNQKEWTDRAIRRLNRLVVGTILPGLRPLRPSDSPETILAYRARGELLGEIGLLRGQPRSATCVAYVRPTEQRGPKQDLEAVELVHLPAALFEDLKRDARFRTKVEQIAEERRRSDVRRQSAPIGAAEAVHQSERFAELGLIQGQRLMLIDLDRCTRCDECVRACVNTHADGRSRLFLDGPRFGRYLVPTTCRSCLDPVCMIGCPVGSIHRGDNGQIVIEDWCIGCEMCAKQCPYGSIVMHDAGVLPESSHGWRAAPADALNGDAWTGPRFRDGDWRPVRAPVALDRDFLAGQRPAAAWSFRRQFVIAREQLAETDEYKIEMTAPPNAEAGLWINGRPLTPQETKKDKRTYRLTEAGSVLRAGQNIAAARVAPPAGYAGTIFDLRIDAVNKPKVGRLNPAEYIEKGVTHTAVVCDLCSTIPGKVPACVNACPHDAAMRVNAQSEFPAD
ncbi:MAG TPA: cyclic nucleotide-binding domain-containing protein [Gemmataceae bacterium]|nr:cyclic nucleotide-binding domain-containing protein [Gemmataceae bacterium]